MSYNLCLYNGSFDLIRTYCLHIFQDSFHSTFFPFCSLIHNTELSLLTVLSIFLSFCQFDETC